MLREAYNKNLKTLLTNAKSNIQIFTNFNTKGILFFYMQNI